MKRTEKKSPEVADIFRQYGEAFRQENGLSSEQLKVMVQIEQCRSEAMGGHREQCDQCGFIKIAYNSCRNRHCPKCQTMKKEQWLHDRRTELLPCGYFHCVFTLTHDLNSIILYNRRLCFNMLFAAVNETFKTFGRDPQWRMVGEVGFIAVLHTWNQVLTDHFHLHCIVPAGVLTREKQWQPARKNYLFRVQSLAKRFKNIFVQKLLKAHAGGKLHLPDNSKIDSKRFDIFAKKILRQTWRAYAKPPFAGPESVLEYLGRYTHRVAISNNRIKNIDNGKVIFSYRDRKDGNKTKAKKIPAPEFIRRFLLHVLPHGFVKIRYFGFLAHTKKKEAIVLIRKLLGMKTGILEKIKVSVKELMLRLTGVDIDCCPQCGQGTMHIIERLQPVRVALFNDSS